MKIFHVRSTLFRCSLFAIIGCANLGDSWTDLGSGYTYQVDGSMRWIRPSNVLKESIYPNVVDYNYDSKFIIALSKPSFEAYKIQLSQELRYKYDSAVYDTVNHDVSKKKFLTSYLWVDSNIHKKVMKELLPDNQTSFEALDKIADSILRNNEYFKNSLRTEYLYWIIVKKDAAVLGPFTKSEFTEQRKTLGVPLSLEFKEK